MTLELTSADGDQYHFAVVDTGQGIDAAERDEIFVPFARGEETGFQTGTGLGLAIARQYVGLMAGQLQVESAPGQGARFFFSLRLSAAPAGAAQEALWQRPVRLAPGQRVRSLVVDDIVTNRDILVRILQPMDIEVEEVASGMEALERTQRQTFDIVFLDLRMPELDGRQTLARLRQQGVTAKMVAVTASVLGYSEEYFRDAGFDAYVGKPFRSGEIAACVERLLGVKLEEDAPVEDEAAVEEEGPLLLPADLAQPLRQAIEVQNATRVTALLDQLTAMGEGERRLADRLRVPLLRFDMDAMLDLLQEVDRD